jgi:hypothetical protein
MYEIKTTVSLIKNGKTLWRCYWDINPDDADIEKLLSIHDGPADALECITKDQAQDQYDAIANEVA